MLTCVSIIKTLKAQTFGPTSPSIKERKWFKVGKKTLLSVHAMLWGDTYSTNTCFVTDGTTTRHDLPDTGTTRMVWACSVESCPYSYTGSYLRDKPTNFTLPTLNKHIYESKPRTVRTSSYTFASQLQLMVSNNKKLVQKKYSCSLRKKTKKIPILRPRLKGCQVRHIFTKIDAPWEKVCWGTGRE